MGPDDVDDVRRCQTTGRVACFIVCLRPSSSVIVFGWGGVVGKPDQRGTGTPSPCASFHLPQVRRANAREPRQDREGSSAKRWHASLRVTWGNFRLLI